MTVVSKVDRWAVEKAVSSAARSAAWKVETTVGVKVEQMVAMTADSLVLSLVG